MIYIASESWELAHKDCSELIKENWEEIALDKDRIPLDVDWDRYAYLDKQNLLRAITVRDNMRLVGYNVYFFGKPIHYNSTFIATNDVLYLAPEYRRGLLGIRLIKCGEQSCWGRGAEMIRMHAKLHNGLSQILEHMGYVLAENIYHKFRGT